MAHKSKTQRAKAAASKAKKKERQSRDGVIREEVNGITTGVDVAEEAEEIKKGIGAKISQAREEKKARRDEAAKLVERTSKKEDKSTKKTRFKFFKDVKAELKRVTWPTRVDVMRWTGVVIGALLFFGIFVAILDNVIVTPALVALSGLGLGA